MPDVTQKSEIDLLNLSQNGSARNVNIPTKEPSFDLLGAFETAEAQGNNTMPDLLSDSQTKPPGLDEIFGSFSSSTATASAETNSTLPDINNIGLNFNAFNATCNSNESNPTIDRQSFDPFGNALFPGSVDVLQPTSKDTYSQQPQQPPIPNATNKDPFADIANLASGLNIDWKAQSQSNTTPKTIPGVSPNTTQFSSPTHQYGGFVASGPTSSTASPRAPSTPMHQARSPTDAQARPDYSRSNFDVKSKLNGNGETIAPTAASVAAGPSAGAGGADIFADILGQQGYNFASKANQGPRSINEMRKEELVKDMDPDKLRILEWVRTKKIKFKYKTMI